jgi:hypothetical protein
MPRIKLNRALGAVAAAWFSGQLLRVNQSFQCLVVQAGERPFMADFVVTCAAREFRAAFKTNLCVSSEPKGCVALPGLTDSAFLLF